MPEAPKNPSILMFSPCPRASVVRFWFCPAESCNIASHKADGSPMDVHLIDGTYELFRYFFAVPSSKDVNGQEVGAVRGVLSSILSMIEGGATHLGVASDHVVESFRNQLYTGYKTSEGVDPQLLSQFPILEE